MDDIKAKILARMAAQAAAKATLATAPTLADAAIDPVAVLTAVAAAPVAAPAPAVVVPTAVDALVDSIMADLDPRLVGLSPYYAGRYEGDVLKIDGMLCTLRGWRWISGAPMAVLMDADGRVFMAGRLTMATSPVIIAIKSKARGNVSAKGSKGTDTGGVPVTAPTAPSTL